MGVENTAEADRDQPGRPVRASGPAYRDVLTIGRSEDNHLRLDDPFVSRHHALVRATGNVVLVEDNGSSGGVYVNGRRIDRPTSLQPGDVVRLGRLDLQLLADDAARAPGPPPGTGGLADAARRGPAQRRLAAGRRDLQHRPRLQPQPVLPARDRAHAPAGANPAPARDRVSSPASGCTGTPCSGARQRLRPDRRADDPSTQRTCDVFEPVIRSRPSARAPVRRPVLIVTGLLTRRSATANERRL